MKGHRETDFTYQAVYRYLTNLINELGADARVRLPSLRQLAERLNVSISTIQYAYSLLEKEGRVYSIAKSGYYALPMVSVSTLGDGDDLLETLYVNARRPGMLVLSGDEPASLQPLDSPLLLLERELLRQYPRASQHPLQPWGEQELRTALAARYTSSPSRCWSADDVYIGADLRGVLEILIAVLALKGNTVLVESPCEWTVLRLLQAADIRVIELPLLAEGEIDIEQLERLLANETVCLMVVSSVLSMPRGRLKSAADRRALARLLEQYGTWVLENDSHTELVFEPGALPFREWLDPDRLIVYSTFETTIGAEAPYGYVLSRQLTLMLQRHFLLRAFRLSPIRQKAIARLYNNGRIDQHLLVLRRLLRESAASATQLLRERVGNCLEWEEPEGGATIWVRSSRQVDLRRVFQRLLARRIVIAPGELFSTQGRYDQHFRLAHALDGVGGREAAFCALAEALRLEQF
ncbi:PLP-dependent aminotransferase family protein [Pseudomonas sp. Z4-7]|uniref:aminotransferase class I/II-fold pyridoxal phosphate-dependent enzyme n=1 Tax=Pseudomonas sp. Z4-7 TaxID=2817413 RepID=UPI003DA937FA